MELILVGSSPPTINAIRHTPSNPETYFMSCRLPVFTSVLFVSCMLSNLRAQAGESDGTSQVAGMSYVSIGAQSDDADTREWLASASLALGDYVWVHAGFGRDKSLLESDTVETTLANGGIGIRGEHLQLTVDFGSRRDDDAYEQRDWTGSFGWRNDVFGMGMDGMSRSTTIQTTQTRIVPIVGARSVLLEQSLDGRGFGLHADVNVTDRLNLFASGMSYSYDDVETNRPALARLLNFSGSGITREQAILDRSLGAGLSYQFELVGLSAQYINDETVDTGEVIHTALLSAAITAGKHWTFTPSAGWSSSDELGDVLFGGVSVSYGW